MIVICPTCQSDDVINLSADSDDFICNACGEDFQADNNLKIEKDLDQEESGFIEIDSVTALKIADQLRRDSNKNKE